MSFYYNYPTLLYPTVFVHTFNVSKPPFVFSFLCLPTPGHLSIGQKTFYPSMSHYTSTVPSSCHFSPPLPSPLASVSRSHSLTTPPTNAWQMLPFVNSENTFEVSKGKSSLNFFQQHLILATMLSSTPPD